MISSQFHRIAALGMLIKHWPLVKERYNIGYVIRYLIWHYVSTQIPNKHLTLNMLKPALLIFHLKPASLTASPISNGKVSQAKILGAISFPSPSLTPHLWCKSCWLNLQKIPRIRLISSPPMLHLWCQALFPFWIIPTALELISWLQT